MDDLLALYVSELRGRLERLRSLLPALREADSQDWAQNAADAYLEAHTIKGNSAQMSFEQTAALAGAMTVMLERGMAEGALPDEAHEALATACAAIQQWADTDFPPSAANGNGTPRS